MGTLPLSPGVSPPAIWLKKKKLKVFGTGGDAVLRPEWTVLLPERAAVIVGMGTLTD